MLRHLYGDGMLAASEVRLRTQLTITKDLNVEDLKTPVLCVRTWKLGNYMQLETLKKVSISSLSDHLNAMALLATDGFLDKREPKWLSHFFDAFQEVCADIVTTPLRNNFISFIWICKFEMGLLPRTLDVLKQYPEVNQELLQLLIKNKPQDGLYWFPNIRNIEWHAKNRKETIRPIEVICSNCRTKIEATKRPIFFNPFPVGQVTTGELKWCRACAENLNGHRKWPWGSCGGGQWEKVKVEAWSWFEDKES